MLASRNVHKLRELRALLAPHEVARLRDGLELPPETVVHPGHREPTTIAAERDTNPFVAICNGFEKDGDEQVTVWGRDATLKLWAPDYDGGNKAWVRWADGRDDIVPGSRVERG